MFIKKHKFSILLILVVVSYFFIYFGYQFYGRPTFASYEQCVEHYTEGKKIYRENILIECEPLLEEK